MKFLTLVSSRNSYKIEGGREEWRKGEGGRESGRKGGKEGGSEGEGGGGGGVIAPCMATVM